MIDPTRGTPHGFAPWHQTSWDWRAAGNFIGGGAGSGLVVMAVLSGATGASRAALLVAGIVLVGLGLASVAAELGRPLRALNVVRNPFSSWMSREALFAGLLVATAAATVAGIDACRWPAALAAAGFLYCQARLLQGGKGIPAWRERAVVPLMLATGLAEGAGLFWLGAPMHGGASLALLAVFAALVIVREVAWRVYRTRVDAALAPRARAALDAAGRVLRYAGTYAPIALAAVAPVAPGSIALALASLAGALAAVAGAFLKHALVTRAAFNQGYALPQVPVRGVRA